MAPLRSEELYRYRQGRWLSLNQRICTSPPIAHHNGESLYPLRLDPSPARRPCPYLQATDISGARDRKEASTERAWARRLLLTSSRRTLQNGLAWYMDTHVSGFPRPARSLPGQRPCGAGTLSHPHISTLSCAQDNVHSLWRTSCNDDFFFFFFAAQT
ncbi:hypothetical protein BX600DRAFT_305460 [Xylariales sp. PMI_506]|nr:hypothetical protein BX600DRAFT_305460 [Xylariales sp. PMI_506]